MKKLVKLVIDPKKSLKNDELIILKGGYSPECKNWCVLREYFQGPIFMEGCCGFETGQQCIDHLLEQWGSYDITCWPVN
jgi:hypothetical protein